MPVFFLDPLAIMSQLVSKCLLHSSFINTFLVLKVRVSVVLCHVIYWCDTGTTGPWGWFFVWHVTKSVLHQNCIILCTGTLKNSSKLIFYSFFFFWFFMWHVTKSVLHQNSIILAPRLKWHHTGITSQTASASQLPAWGRTANGFVFKKQNLVYVWIIDSEPSKGDAFDNIHPQEQNLSTRKVSAVLQGMQRLHVVHALAA
jgi:hypothetical protein